MLLESVASMTHAALNSPPAVFQAMDQACRAAHQEIDVCLVFVPEGTELVCVFVSGERAQWFARCRLAIDGRSLPALCAQARHCVDLKTPISAIVPTDRFAVAIPLQFDGRLQAVAYFSSKQQGRFTNSESIRLLVSQAAAPYFLAREREADRAAATFDSLTGLYTARAFREHVMAQIRACALRPRASLSLWFIDTDGFKQINDTLGHSTGDRVLRQVAAILRGSLNRDGDFAGRNGGDEFCALIGAHKIEAIERAQQFCSDLRAQDFGIARRVTVSVGVAAYPHDAQSANALFEAADAAMYHSKRSGRDCVSFAGAPERFIVCR